MMTNIGGLYFSLCAVVCLVGALITVMARNPIRGALGLLSTIVGIAGLFLLLRAQFLAAVQMIVYAGAVVVLFVFVILLLGADANDPSGPGKAKVARVLGSVLLIALGGAASFLLAPELRDHPMPFVPAPSAHGSVAAVGTMIFVQGLVPFELATALLIVAVVGAIALGRSSAATRRPGVPLARREEANPTLRLFHGPVHPRDAGYPLPKGTER
jgi:NADH-quinone oxidoreductase subunit J